MKHKRLLLALASVAAVFTAGYLALRLMPPRHRINLDNTRAIEKGMTEEEAVKILGVRAGDYSSTKPGGTFLYHQKAVSGTELVRMRGGKFWASDETGVWLRFDDAGRVAEAFCGSYYENQSFLDRIRDWLGI
jgi:hypothetical protein